MIIDGTTYNDKTPTRLAWILDTARIGRRRIRLFYGDTDTGVDWLDEWCVAGRIGRSMGPQKIPLLLANSRSTGGPGILDHCIVRLLVDGREVYRHPKYQAPTILVSIGGPADLPIEVSIGGKLHARFSSMPKASRWVLFMQGRRATK